MPTKPIALASPAQTPAGTTKQVPLASPDAPSDADLQIPNPTKGKQRLQTLVEKKDSGDAAPKRKRFGCKSKDPQNMKNKIQKQSHARSAAATSTTTSEGSTASASTGEGSTASASASTGEGLEAATAAPSDKLVPPCKMHFRNNPVEKSNSYIQHGHKGMAGRWVVAISRAQDEQHKLIIEDVHKHMEDGVFDTKSQVREFVRKILNGEPHSQMRGSAQAEVSARFSFVLHHLWGFGAESREEWGSGGVSGYASGHGVVQALSLGPA